MQSIKRFKLKRILVENISCVQSKLKDKIANIQLKQISRFTLKIFIFQIV